MKAKDKKRYLAQLNELFSTIDIKNANARKIKTAEYCVDIETECLKLINSYSERQLRKYVSIITYFDYYLDYPINRTKAQIVQWAYDRAASEPEPEYCWFDELDKLLKFN